MRAAIYRSAGTSEVLAVTEVPTPEPGPGEVRVRVAVSGVNPTDWKSLAGGGDPGWEYAVPNQDGAGVIDAVGEGVSAERIGQRVWLLMAARERRWGTAAQYSVVPTERAVPLPTGASFELGASLGVPALTAWHCLAVGGSVSGTSVLVSGGAGAVGHMAIQLARWAGAGPVIATVSGPEKAQLARAAGAHAVVDYHDADAAEQIRAAAPEGGVERIVEVALAANVDLDLEVAAPHAVICAYADSPDHPVSFPARPLMTANLTLAFMLLYTIRPGELAAAIEAVNRAVAEDALAPLPLHRFGLEDVAAAHDAVRAGAVGKVILEIE